MKKVNSRQIKELLRKGGVDLSALSIYWNVNKDRIEIQANLTKYAEQHLKDHTIHNYLTLIPKCTDELGKAMFILSTCGFSFVNLMSPNTGYIFYINQESLISVEKYEMFKEMNADGFNLYLRFS